MNEKKRLIVNFSSIGRENYLAGTDRLIRCVNDIGLDTDILICSPDLNIDSDSKEIIMDNGNTIFLEKRMPRSIEFGECPPHKDAPYAFKSYMIQEGLDRGYKRILWADSSCVFLKDIEKYWLMASEVGVITLDNPGCPMATWTSDDCLEHLGMDKDLAKTFFQIDAFILMFDFYWPLANEVFKKYFEHSRDGICLKGLSGSDRPDFRAHRHDQSIMSAIVKQHNIHPLNYGAWCYATEALEGKFYPTFVKLGLMQPFEFHRKTTNEYGLADPNFYLNKYNKLGK